MYSAARGLGERIEQRKRAAYRSVFPLTKEI